MTNRIYFEKFLSEDDFEYFSELAFNEKVMVMNMGRVFTLEEAKMVFNGTLKNNKIHKDFGGFKVFEKATNTFIGEGCIFINKDFTKAEIEYLLLPEYWGKRYGSEIVENLLKIAEETKSIQEVTAITDPDNKVSKKILSNNGFVSCKVYKIDDGSLAEKFSKKIIRDVV